MRHKLGSPTLYNLTSDLIWPDVIYRARSHPEEVCWRDDNGGTALHHSCRHQYSVDVVREMLKSKDAVACIQDKFGSTPLHIACWSGSSEIVRLLVDTYRDAASAQDKKGRTPLHVACSACPPPSVGTIEALINADPEVINIPDSLGQTPLSLLCARHDSRLNMALDMINRGLSSAEIVNDILGAFWRQLCLLLKANVRKCFSSGDEWRLLHALTTIPDCPRVLFQLAMKLYPEQVEESLNGSLPLHYAAECPTSLIDDIHQDGYYVCSLLLLFPKASKVPNLAGQLPLHIAVASGKSWDGVVEKLFSLFPSALMMKDGKSCLYPFMVAALPKPDHCLRKLEVDLADVSCQQLTSTYELLIADPTLVSHPQ